MAQLTVRQAAEQVGISRQTMFKMVSEGKVSATTISVPTTGAKQKTVKMIDTSELLRVFGELQSATDKKDSKDDNQRQPEAATATPPTMEVLIELAELRARVQAETDRANKAEDREREAREAHNRVLTLLEQQTKLLPAPEDKDGKKGFFSRLFS